MKDDMKVLRFPVRRVAIEELIDKLVDVIESVEPGRLSVAETIGALEMVKLTLYAQQMDGE